MNEQHERHPDPTEISHAIGAQGQLTINNVSGSVQLRGTDSDEAVVIARSESGRSEWLPLTVQKSEGALTVDVEKRGSFAMFGTWFGTHDGMEFKVTVPRTARVIINSVSADISAHFLAGEQTYKTVSGDVELDPDGGRVRVTTVSGDVEVRPAEPLNLSISTTSGDIRVEGAVINLFEARTVSGDIELDAGFAAGPLHSIESVSGDLSIESSTGVTVDVKRGMDMRRGGSRGMVAGDGTAQIRFRTLSGDCHVVGARDLDDDRDERRRRHGKHEDRLERQIERHAERVARRVSAKARGFAGVPPIVEMPDPWSPAPAPAAPFSSVRESEAGDQLEVLRALERGEIDVEEAARRLQEA